MSDYAIQIIYNEQYTSESGQILTRPKIIVLDAVEDSSISASNTITNHPIVSGDMVADHAYKNPQTYSFSGSIGSSGHKGVVVDSSGISLANFEELLLNLKDNAYLCEIVKICVNDANDVRFMRHSKMVLENIQTVEKINTLSYTLTFRQVFVVEVQTLDIDMDDAYLPNITEPQTTSFTDALIDWSQVDAAVITGLRESKLMTDEFLQFLSSLGQSATLAIVGGAIAASITIKIMLALTQCVSVPVVGWAAGVTATVIFAYGLIKSFISAIEREKYKLEQFKRYGDDKRNAREVERFYAFTGDVHKQIERLNDVIYVYSIDSDEEQEATISIDGNYYIFTFTKNNVGGTMKCVVTDQENAIRATLSNVFSSPTNYNACTTANSLFRADGSGAYVYIINGNPESQTSLQNCFICVSKIKPEDYANALADIIRNAYTR